MVTAPLSSSLQEAFFSKACKRPLSPAMTLSLCSRVVNHDLT
jgi:hypothetical protein